MSYPIRKPHAPITTKQIEFVNTLQRQSGLTTTQSLQAIGITDGLQATINRAQAAELIAFLKAQIASDARAPAASPAPATHAMKPKRKRNYSNAASAHRDFPLDVNSATPFELVTYFERFPRPMIRVFLDAMGVPMGKHGNNASQSKLIHKCIYADTDKARRVISTLTAKRYGSAPAASPAPAPVPKNITIKVNGAKARVLKGIVPEQFETIVSLAEVRQNILLTGPSGCGKTYLAGKLADVLDLEYGSVSCSVGMSESHLAGWLLPVGDNGRFSHVPTAFVECYEQGGVFLFDELDAADENTLLFVNTALANDGFHLAQRHESPWVAKHADFVCVAAANTMGHGESTLYSGRNMLDGATMDRFRAGVVQMNYSAQVEQSLVDDEILNWGRAVREVIAKHGYDRLMSTRVLLDFTAQKDRLDWGLDHFKRSYFADWTAEERNVAGTLAAVGVAS